MVIKKKKKQFKLVTQKRGSMLIIHEKSKDYLMESNLRKEMT